MKKNILSKVLTLGIIATPILVGTTLISTSNINANSSSSNIISKNISPPTMWNNRINKEFVGELIAYKKATIPEWSGYLYAADFDGAKVVGNNAFSTANDVNAIFLPNSVTELESNAFNNNSSISSIQALGVTNIYNDAFKGMTGRIFTGGIKLTDSINIKPLYISRWGYNYPDKFNFSTAPVLPDPPIIPRDKIISKEFIDKLVAHKKLTIPGWDGSLVVSDFYDNVNNPHTVADGAFQNNTQVKSIVLQTSITSIGANAFSGAANLATLSALGVTSIGNNAFSGTRSITNDGIKLTYSQNIKPGNISNWGNNNTDKYLIKNSPNNPLVPKVINAAFINELIAYKISMSPSTNPWDGILVEADFIDVTSVASGAFQNNTKITSITLPNTVKSIGANAFNGASKLTTISALGVTSIGANAFSGMLSLGDKGIKLTYSENIKNDNATVWGTVIDKLNIIGAPSIKPEVPGGIITPEFVNQLIIYKKETITNWNGSLVESDFVGANSIAVNAFQDNIEITSIILPTSVISIGANAFSGAFNLTTISALGVKTIGENTFDGTTSIIPNGIKLTYSTNIKPANAILWGTVIDNLSITNSPIKPTVPLAINAEFVDKLIEYKYYMSSDLNLWNGSLVADDFVNATSVAPNAFQYNTEITSIILPTSVISIGANAFDGALNLKTISALGVTSIGANAFSETISIVEKGIKLTKSTNITVDKFATWGLNSDISLDIIEGEVIPPVIQNGIITPEFVDELIIYKNSISSTRTPWNGSLVESDFVGATSVANVAFENKSPVKSIVLPRSVTSIGEFAFNGATNLTTISALGVTSIGANAFSGMLSLGDKGIKLTESANITSDKFLAWGLTSETSLDIITTPITGGGFFDDVNNIYMIAGIGAGILLLIAAGLTGFLIYRKNANGSDSDEKETKLKIKDEARDEAIRRLKIEQRLKDAKKSNK